jgi:hypothetical protein
MAKPAGANDGMIDDIVRLQTELAKLSRENDTLKERLQRVETRLQLVGAPSEPEKQARTIPAEEWTNWADEKAQATFRCATAKNRKRYATSWKELGPQGTMLAHFCRRYLEKRHPTVEPEGLNISLAPLADDDAIYEIRYELRTDYQAITVKEAQAITGDVLAFIKKFLPEDAADIHVNFVE